MASLLRNKISSDVRPVVNAADAVPVDLHLMLTQIVEMDEREQVLTSNLWMRLTWLDAFLTWDPAEYENVTSLRVNAHKVWRPDILLFNSVRFTSLTEFDDMIPVKVFYNGTVTRVTPFVSSSACVLDMRIFPWDIQHCPLIYGSWSYDKTAITLTCSYGGGDTRPLMRHSEWDVLAMPASHVQKVYAIEDIVYEEIHYCIIIKRKTLYYLFHLVLPGICVVALSGFVFFLPQSSGEKMTFSVTALLSLMFFLNMVAECTPVQSEVIPLLSQYFGVCVVIMTLSIISTVCILRVSQSYCYNRPVPKLLKRYAFGVVAKYIGLESICKMSQDRIHSTNKQHHLNEIKKTTTDNSKAEEQLMEDTQSPPSLFQIAHAASRLEEHITINEETSDIKSEWIFLAMVLDRCFLILFVLVTFFMSIGILVIKPQNISKSESTCYIHSNDN